MASFSMFLVTTSLMLLIMVNNVEGGSVGVNFGRQASQKLLPSMAVDMCLANGISKVKLFSMNEGLMSAFARSNIELIVAIPNVELYDLNKTELVKPLIDKIVQNINDEVDIRYVCVGVEPFEKLEKENDMTNFVNNVVPRLNNMAEYIKNGTINVKLGVPSSVDLLEPVSKPSEARFKQEHEKNIIRVLEVLNRTDSPFMMNLYPYLSVMRNKDRWPFEFGLFDKQSNFTVIDGNRTYTNIFDFEYDSYAWAIRKLNFGNVKLMVSQIGWPTDGGPGANVKTAKRFYDGLLKKIAFHEGTPLMRGTELDVYIYALADENQRNTIRGPFERHYGIYTYNGKAKFNIDFTLQGRDVEPEPARGVTYLPQRWCVFNENAKQANNATFVDEQVRDVCTKDADCTALENGGSCSSLDRKWKTSYVFNMYFQMSNQEQSGDATCTFHGLGKVVYEKPSFPDCDFRVEILSTLFVNGMSDNEMEATLGKSTGERLRLGYQFIVIIPLWILFFLRERIWL